MSPQIATALITPQNRALLRKLLVCAQSDDYVSDVILVVRSPRRNQGLERSPT